MLGSVRGGPGELLLFAALILIVVVHKVWAAVHLAQGHRHVLELTDVEWFISCVLIERIVVSWGIHISSIILHAVALILTKFLLKKFMRILLCITLGLRGRRSRACNLLLLL